MKEEKGGQFMVFSSRQQVCAERVIMGVLNILCVRRLGPRRFLFTLTKVNNNPFPVILRYTTTQRFDFAVRSVATGREVWRWSFNRFFAQVIEEIRLRPGQETSQTVEWDGTNNFGVPVPGGRYILRGENLARVRRVDQPGEIDVIPQGGEAMAKMPQLQAEFTLSANASSQQPSTVHTVQPGDTLWAIARQYGTTVSTLKSINSLVSSNIKVGQLIKVR